jgi:murein DD-endopeptidase MepM/ murein hydrolase activator NlpD
MEKTDKSVLRFVLAGAVLVSGMFFYGCVPNFGFISPQQIVSSSTQSGVTEQPGATQQSSSRPASSQQVSAEIPNPLLTAPVAGGLQRVTKKPFGIYVTPQNSPVSPEHFRGYHTGIDFETYPGEQNSDVAVRAACTGPLLLKKTAQGYGGVAVQQCRLEGQDVTVIYGHLRYSSIRPDVQTQLQAGEQFAVLGTGYSSETDGERKHLHFGIHKGTAVNILGYVQNKSDLGQWLDPAKYL